MTEPYEEQEITCEEAQLQMTYMWADDPKISFDEREIFGAHLSACRKCYNEFQETIWLVNLFKWYAKEGKQLLSQPEPAKGPTTAEEPEEAVKRRRKLFWRIGTAAAVATSIIIAVVVGWNTLFAPSGISKTTLITQFPAGPELQGTFVELITPSSRQTVPLGQPVHAKSQLQELLLSDMHWVTLNHDSFAKNSTGAATQEIQSKTGELRYEIELAKGETYAEVVPDHPFMVRTDNAHLISGDNPNRAAQQELRSFRSRLGEP